MPTYTKFSGKIHALKDIITRATVSLIPRDKKLIVYGGSWDLFIDNAKHQFILNNETMPDFRHVWLTKNKEIVDYMQEHGFQVAESNSLLGIWLLLRAGFIVYDDGINYFSKPNLAVGAHRINIWHGVPAKMIGRCKRDEDCINCNSLSKWHNIRYSTYGEYMICTSESMVRIFSYSFQIPANKIIISGYPRTRIFFMSEKQRLEYIKKYEPDTFQKFYDEIWEMKQRKIIYMPTFRDKNRQYLTQAIPDWNKLNAACQKANTVLFVKVHRVTPLPDTSGYSNIRIMDNKMDIYPLLPLFDMLITDYSSIMFDFSLLRKKILLYTYDMEEYRSQSRPIYNYFDGLLKNLSSVDNFDDFIKSMNTDIDTIKSFPSDRFFDCPNNFEEIGILIKGLA